MKIVKISGISTVPVVTDIHRSKEGKKYHNIKHGSYGNDMWMWSMSLDYKLFPVVNNTVITLDSNEYIIKPVYCRNTILKDYKDNIVYNMLKDKMSHHSNDLIVLWEPVFANIVKLEYTLEGDVSELGLGYTGRVRGNESMIIPVPVLEVTGDCKLSWIGVSKAGKEYKQILEYDYIAGNWNIGIPTLKE